LIRLGLTHNLYDHQSRRTKRNDFIQFDQLHNKPLSCLFVVFAMLENIKNVKRIDSLFISSHTITQSHNHTIQTHFSSKDVRHTQREVCSVFIPTCNRWHLDQQKGIDTLILCKGRVDSVQYSPSLSILVVICVFFPKQRKYHHSDCELSADVEWISFLSL
jgi:hypothetical protein